MFIAHSMAIIDINDIPIAVLNAKLKSICLERIIVSSIIDVINPLIIARHIMAQTGQLISIN
jgi:hypothetical protein